MTRLLLVDDEPLVLSTLKRMMKIICPKIAIDSADNGDEAIGLLEKQGYDIIVSDRRMPRMSGEELLQISRSYSPFAIRCLLSGDPPASTIVSSDGLVFAQMEKPCKVDLMGSVIGLMSEISERRKMPGVLEASQKFTAKTRVTCRKKDEDLDLAYDGRSSGVRWFETRDAFSPINSSGKSSYSSLSRLTDSDLLPAIAILVGVFEAASEGAYSDKVNALWAETLDEMNKTRAHLISTSGDRDVSMSLIAIMASRIADLVAIVLGDLKDISSMDVCIALLLDWGFGFDIFHKVLRPNSLAATQQSSLHLERSPMAFASLGEGR